MTNDSTTSPNFTNKAISYGLLFFFALMIFFISEVIRTMLVSYELETMYVSFCAGFILFIPLVSLILHPLVFSKENQGYQFHLSAFLKNIGLVLIIQFVFFIIWMTDAIAIYSIYVDQTSFLAKIFNINTENRTDFSQQFYWANLILACFFALISLIVGVLPCLIARINNKGIVNNFVTAFSFAKNNKKTLMMYAVLLAISVVLPLLYVSYLFLITFPIALKIVFFQLSSQFLD